MDRKERIILLLLTVLNFTHIIDFMIMMPLGNYLMPYFDISSQQFSMLVAAYTFSEGASGFLAAYYHIPLISLTYLSRDRKRAFL